MKPSMITVLSAGERASLSLCGGVALPTLRRGPITYGSLKLLRKKGPHLRIWLKETLLDTSRTRRPGSYYNLSTGSTLHVLKLGKELSLGILKRMELLRERREREGLISTGTRLKSLGHIFFHLLRDF
jgi:hypothetical protein